MDELKKQIIIGCMLRSEMQLHGIRQKEMSKKLGISQQNLSQMISGKVSIDPKKIKTAFTLMGCKYSFNFDENKIAELENYYHACYDEFYFLSEPENLKQLKGRLMDEDFYSFALPYYLLLSLLKYWYQKDWNALISLIEMIEKEYMVIFETAQKAFILTLKTVWYFENNLCQEALELLQEVESFDYLPHLSMVYLVRGVVSFRLRDTLDALLYSQKAEELFTKNRNINRAIAASNNIGRCYSQLKEYDKAIVHHMKALKEAKRYSRPYMIQACYRNIAYAYFKLENYKEAIYWANQISPDAISKKESNYFSILAWSYFHLDDYKMCRKYKDLLKNGAQNKYFNLMADLLELYLQQKDSKEKAEILEEMIQNCEENEKHSDILWCSELLIKEYKTLGDYRRLAECQERVLKILRWTQAGH